MKKNIFSLMLSICLSVGIICLAQCEENKGKPDESKQGGGRGADETLTFKKFKSIDSQGIGIEAFSMLIPSSWQAEGGIRWVLENPGMPAVADFRVKNPSGKEEFQAFPTLAFFWTDNPMLLSSFPVGSRYFGSEVRPPQSPLEALKKTVVPAYRQDVSGLKVVSEARLPDLARTLGAGMQSAPGIMNSADAAKIRIEYQRAGASIEEEIYGVVETVSFPIQSMMGSFTNTNWMVEYLFSFKAEKGKLDGQAKLFETMVSSFRINPQWFNKYNQVIEYLVQRQIQNIQTIGQISKIISQTHNEISDSMMQSYNERQAVNDRIADNFSQHIRGVDEYYNPIEQKSVELPSGYTNAWTNNLGEYIVSDQEDFNPNIGSNMNWQKIEKTK